MIQEKLKLKNYRNVHKDFRIDGVSPKDLRELWKDAQKELLEELAKFCEDKQLVIDENYLRNKLEELN